MDIFETVLSVSTHHNSFSWINEASREALVQNKENLVATLMNHGSTLVHELNNEAKECFKKGDIKEAIDLYDVAIRQCKYMDMTSEASVIHSNLAHIFLETGDYISAHKHCTFGIGYNAGNAIVSLTQVMLFFLSNVLMSAQVFFKPQICHVYGMLWSPER